MLHTYGRASQKNESFFFGIDFVAYECWWRMGDSGIPLHIRSAVWNHVYHRLRTVFDQNPKKKSSLGFNWRMVLCAEILGFNPEHYIICCFDLCLVKEIKKSFSKPKDIQIQSCFTHTMQPCSTKGVLPGIFWGTFVGVFFGSGDRSIRWKWDGTDCWLEFSSNNFGEFRKQFCIKFGLKHGQLWGLAIFRLDL